MTTHDEKHPVGEKKISGDAVKDDIPPRDAAHPQGREPGEGQRDSAEEAVNEQERQLAEGMESPG